MSNEDYLAAESAMSRSAALHDHGHRFDHASMVESLGVGMPHNARSRGRFPPLCARAYGGGASSTWCMRYAPLEDPGEGAFENAIRAMARSVARPMP